jgi:ribonuclease P protein component
VRSRDNLFSVFAVANATQQSRLGVTVSRKTARLAVTRNRIKRQVRESFRLLPADRLSGLDVVVVAQPPAAKTAAQVLRHSLASHWQRIQDLCAPSR